jgi:hypothetical protein
MKSCRSSNAKNLLLVAILVGLSPVLKNDNMKIKVILFATKEGSSELEQIQEDIVTDGRLMLLPSPELFANNTKLSIRAELLEEEDTE